MEGSGLQGTLEIIYVPNTTQCIISGKANSRDVQRRILIDWVLNALLFTELYDTEDGADSADMGKIFSASDKFTEFFAVYFGTLEDHTDMKSIKTNLSLVEAAKIFSSLKKSLSRSLDRVYENDRHTEEVYQRRAYRELRSSPSGS